MELRDYLRVARRQWWVVALTVIAAMGIAALFTAQTKPLYASTVQFFIATGNVEGSSALEGAMFAQQRLKTYEAVLTGERLAGLIAANDDTSLTPEQIRERISVVSDSATVLIDVTVEDADPELAQSLCEELAAQFPTLVKRLETPDTGVTKTPMATIETMVPPMPHGTPVVPRPMHNLALGVAMGLLVGTALGVGREIADRSVRDPRKLRELTAAPVLACIPRDRRAALIADRGSPRAEALRQLRTTVQFAGKDRPVKTLAVTSAMPGEGRSATACGLAILFAETGRRVLIVDAELRRPRLAAFLGREGSAGLTTVLVGAASLDQVLQPWGAGLWLLSSGHPPPNPSELLGSQRMGELLDELRGRFDLVILDSPPLLPVADGAVVAARADGALLLVRSRKTTTAQVAGAMRALKQVDARLLGCVFTMVTSRRACYAA
ncbi:chromosome partitioning protein [Paractinoplanes deccanensis]|uniref:Chromosome partitioning protein n=1 Tax=Paractinoplanes deccanensis TaxID=113561 RepID=A0ABQ3YKH6_9ACTN|nr:polysaccharide biosynthesis tyrosine autokinase [Actinoplanes deccanensis]GID80514.1 chromosome partitioning protein [Actinoplanes deccanensis]